MPGEHSQDESRSLSSYDRFKSEAFSILDVILNSIEARFMPNEGLLGIVIGWILKRFHQLIL